MAQGTAGNFLAGLLQGMMQGKQQKRQQSVSLEERNYQRKRDQIDDDYRKWQMDQAEKEAAAKEQDREWVKTMREKGMIGQQKIADILNPVEQAGIFDTIGQGKPYPIIPQRKALSPQQAIEKIPQIQAVGTEYGIDTSDIISPYKEFYRQDQMNERATANLALRQQALLQTNAALQSRNRNQAIMALLSLGRLESQMQNQSIDNLNDATNTMNLWGSDNMLGGLPAAITAPFDVQGMKQQLMAIINGDVEDAPVTRQGIQDPRQTQPVDPNNPQSLFSFLQGDPKLRQFLPPSEGGQARPLPRGVGLRTAQLKNQNTQTQVAVYRENRLAGSSQQQKAKANNVERQRKLKEADSKITTYNKARDRTIKVTDQLRKTTNFVSAWDTQLSSVRRNQLAKDYNDAIATKERLGVKTNQKPAVTLTDPEMRQSLELSRLGPKAWVAKYNPTMGEAMLRKIMTWNKISRKTQDTLLRLDNG